MSPDRPRALVVDDEAQMLDIVQFALETQGFVTESARDAESAWHLVQRTEYDLIVLDIMLPRASGMTLCRRIRERYAVPVLMLTARTDTEHRLEGLEAGADDYVTKPFHPRELALRAQAIVRRYRARQSGGVIEIRGLRIDPAGHTVTVDGKRVVLTTSEFRLLLTLATRAGEVVPTRDLVAAVWSSDSEIGARDMLRTAIYRLRARLGDDPAVPRYIETVRGAGYVMPLDA